MSKMRSRLDRLRENHSQTLNPASHAELELYDYEHYPLETKNLANEQPEVVKQLRAILVKYPEAVSNAAIPPQNSK